MSMSSDEEASYSSECVDVDVETVEAELAERKAAVLRAVWTPRVLGPAAAPAFLYDRDENFDSTAKLARKDKSLGLLCKKFLDYMIEQSTAGTKIHLESTAASLGVEKRRIYDIVNVMEAMDAMSKHTKSFYVWNGMDHLPRLMAELRSIAFAEGLPDRIRDVERAMCSFSLPQDGEAVTGQRGSSEGLPWASRESAADLLSPELIATRDRGARNSLSLLCRRFLMVLLCSPTENKVSLDVASTVLIKDPYTDGFEPPSRSRCRRLYDIANVLVAMGIIKKIHYLFGTKKIPLFLYCGPKPDMNGPPIPVVERLSRGGPWEPPLLKPSPRGREDRRAVESSSSGDEGPAGLERKSSLLDMCEVAEAERLRMRREEFVLPKLGKTASEIECYEAGKALKSIMDGTDDDNKENISPNVRPKPSAIFQSPVFNQRLLIQQAEERRRLYQSLQERTAETIALGGAAAPFTVRVGNHIISSKSPSRPSHVVKPMAMKAGGRLERSGLVPPPIGTPPKAKKSPSATRVISIRRPWLESPKNKVRTSEARGNVLVRVMGGNFYSPAPTTLSPKTPPAKSPAKSIRDGPLDLSKLGPGSFTITETGSLKRRLPLSPIKSNVGKSGRELLRIIPSSSSLSGVLRPANAQRPL